MEEKSLEQVKQEYADYRTKTERMIDEAQKAIKKGLEKADKILCN